MTSTLTVMASSSFSSGPVPSKWERGHLATRVTWLERAPPAPAPSASRSVANVSRNHSRNEGLVSITVMTIAAPILNAIPTVAPHQSDVRS